MDMEHCKAQFSAAVLITSIYCQHFYCVFHDLLFFINSAVETGASSCFGSKDASLF
jgi:hypothetical protein